MARTRILVGLIAAGALGLAWLVRFGCDDAYISYVYAKALVHGDGLTWFGAHVEGYTNFGWVLWIAGGLAAGADPLVWAWVGSLAALVAAILVTARIANLRTTGLAAVAAAGVLATNYTFLAFGTSGLETMAQTALLVTAWWQVEQLSRDPPAVRRLVLLSLCAAFALWVRLDSAVMLAVLGAVAARRLVAARASARMWLAAIAPAAVLVGAWLAWKVAYYGELLPNTFYAKTGSGAIEHGARYAGAFFHTYGLWPLLLLAAVVAIVRRSFPSRLPAALVGVWTGYVMIVGGDFMEFRFFVPVMPAIAVILAELATLPAPPRMPSPPVRAGALVAVLAALSVHHATTFRGNEDFSYDSITSLARFYGLVNDGDWGKLGRPLNEVLGGTSATLACEGAGIIPYFAELPTVDQLGLNDAWVARNGAQAPARYARPGHQKSATYEYLVERKVTFVIGTPTIIPHGSLRSMPDAVRSWLAGILKFAPPPPVPTFDVVAVPIGGGRDMLMWYLTPSPDVTAAVRAAHWDGVRVRRPTSR